MRHFSGGLLLALLVTACKTAAPVVQQTPPEPVILTLGNKAFTTTDFFQSFTKNQLSSDSAQRTDVKSYFDLYTNLKLKVLAAESDGRDTTEAFREEMNTYRKQLAQSYLIDKVLVESLAAEAYQRLQEEVDASHILTSVSDYATPADTLAAYQTSLSLRKRAENGEDFANLAREYSQDVNTAASGGNLGYVPVFGIVYPLETAAFTTPTGRISAPVRTRFGYHIIKVNNRRPSRGRVRVAHILVRMSPSADDAGQKAAQERINAAYSRLQKGDSFEQVCRQLSDDATSKASGGVLPMFEPGRWVPAFEDAAFSLTRPGDYTRPVRTNYGWHIIKLLERKSLDSYTILGPSLRQRVTTDSRADVVRQATVQRLQKEYSIKPDQALLESALTRADSNLLTGKWHFTEPLDPALQNKTVVTIGDQPYTVNQFFGYVQQRQQPPRNPALATMSASNTVTSSIERPVGGSPTIAMRRLFDRFVGDQLMATEEANLEKKSPEFRSLLNEIRDGVLLSQAMEQNVWERSMVDSTGQRQYFEQNKANYRFPERAQATIIVAQNDSLLKQATTLLSGRPPYQLRRSAAPLSFDKGRTALTPGLRETLFDVLVVMSANPDYVIEVSGSHDPTESDSVSAGRIRTVVNYLQKNGVSLNRIMEKDFQGARPGATKDAQRNVAFQYFSNAKDDVAKVMNSKFSAPVSSTRTDGPTPPSTPAVSITTGLFARGENPYLDTVSEWKAGPTTLRRDNKAIAILIDRIEPARAKTFAEARGTVINEYQATLEKQWLAQLRQTYPIKVNDDEIRKLAK